jgi:ribonuclease J
MELAQQHGRKVAVVGRSLDNSTEIAQDLGYLDLPPGLMINPGQIKDMPPEQGAGHDLRDAGRADVALSRAAVNNHKFAQHRCGRHGAAELARDSGQ